MPSFRLFFTAVAAITLGLAPQSSFAFAPPAATKAGMNTRQHFSAIPSRKSLKNNYHAPTATTSLYMSEQKSNLPVFLDPGTKGGAVVLSILLFIVPILIYQVATGVFGMDGIEVGRNIGVGFSVFTMLLWGSTYIFRVATKDMTYAKQLKDYEDAVIAKRLEELDEDEVQALVEDIEREQF